MSARIAVARALWTDPAMNALGLTREKFLSGEQTTPAVRPYVVARWGDTSPGVADSRQRALVLWFHDQPNDYTRIDAMLRRARQILEALHTTEITQVDWIVDSGDLSDPESKTIIRTTTFNVVASGM